MGLLDSKLDAHISCHQQSTGLGTGLRYLHTDDVGCTTSSLQEAELILNEASRLLGEPWTNQHGETRPLTAHDLIVVAPYNDQVQLIQSLLADDRATAAIRVGTVDKFQGQEAAVVFFSMATSSVADMPRGPEFLFSRNQLNVAISRTRCLAYLTCTQALLDSTARDVDMMKLLSTLCALEASSTSISATGR